MPFDNSKLSLSELVASVNEHFKIYFLTLNISVSRNTLSLIKSFDLEGFLFLILHY